MGVTFGPLGVVIFLAPLPWSESAGICLRKKHGRSKGETTPVSSANDDLNTRATSN
jgi:hypothetical protein